jgi:tetratricopeptide (TPR) repeat protein
MANAQESDESKGNDTGVMIQESVEKLMQAFQMERDKTRERAEQESSKIITNAREEAGEIIAQAKQEAQAESDKLIVKYKEEGEQILRESRAKASIQARQESERIITESIEKTKRIINEIIELGLTQAKTEFVRCTSEAGSKLESEKSKLLSVTKSIEQIINETETNIQVGFEHLANAITETKKKLQTVHEIPFKENVSNFRQVAEEATETESIEKPEKQETKLLTVEEAGDKAEEARKQADREVGILIQKGIELRKSGKHEDSIRAFQKAIELDPKNVIAWREKGTALAWAGKYDDALETYNKTLEIDPNDIDTLNVKVGILKSLGRKEEVKEAEEEERRARKEAKQAGHS